MKRLPEEENRALVFRVKCAILLPQLNSELGPMGAIRIYKAETVIGVTPGGLETYGLFEQLDGLCILGLRRGLVLCFVEIVALPRASECRGLYLVVRLGFRGGCRLS